MTELFRLIGKVSIDNSSANESIDETVDKAEKSQSKLSGIGGKIAKGLSSIAKVAAGIIASVSVVAGGALVAMSTQAVQCYADYEQLVGGVETLFGAGGQSIEEYAASVGKSVSDVQDEYKSLMTAQDTVIGHAREAFKTAGLSANDYMETVTSFSAALISSLDGDTVKAAGVADKAIIDMSDNANKMGSAMESIQNAYQGFAKQNYTMLDNLKLGYGGTKEEMQRLLVDANELNKQQGIITDFSIENFADIVEAIHVIQDNMGITGTTAKEAATTIQGSIGMMKAAWTNFLTGMADPDQDFDALLGNLVDSVVTVADNLVPRIAALLPRLVLGLSQLAQSLARYLPDIVGQLLPALISGVSALVGELVTAIPAILKVLIPVLFSSISEIFTSVAGMLSGSGALQSLQGLFSEGFGEEILHAGQRILTFTQRLNGETVELFAGKLGSLREMFSAVQSVLQPLVETYILNLMQRFENLIFTIENVVLPVISLLIDGFFSISTTILTAIQPAIMRISAVWSEMSGLISDFYSEMILPTIGAFIEMLSELFAENQDKLTKIGEIFSTVFNLIASIVEWFYASVVQGILLPAVELITTWVFDNMGQIKAIFQSAFDYIGGIVQFFTALFKGDWSGMWTAVQTILSAGCSFIQNVFQLIQNFISAAGSAIWSIITNAFENSRMAIVNRLTAAQQSIASIFNAVKTFISAIGSTIWSIVANTFENVRISIVNKLSEARETISNIFNSIKETVTNAWNTVTNVIQAGIMFIGNLIQLAIDIILIPWNFIWQNCGDKITEVWNTISSFISEKFHEIADFINTVLATICELFNSIWSAIYETISVRANAALIIVTTTFNAIRSAISTICSAIWSLITNIFENVYAAIVTKLTAAQQSITNIFNAVKTFISVIGSAIWSIITNAFENSRMAIVNKLTAAQQSITNIFNAVKTFISAIGSTIWSIVANTFENVRMSIVNKLTEAKASVVSIFTTIKDEINNKMEAAKQIVSNAVQKLKDLFNFNWELPKIKLPHFKIDGNFSLDPPSAPSFGIEWYKNGAVMLEPTAFGINPASGKVMAGGEAGKEAIAPIETLKQYVSEAVAGQNSELIGVLGLILEAIYALDEGFGEKLFNALLNIKFQVNEREFARLVRAV